MNSYDLSRKWFDWCFENPEKIKIEDILKYSIKRSTDYKEGGFYLILNRTENKCYIGKSINYMARLKQHLYPSNKITNIDIELKNSLDEFEFYLLANYLDLDINFHNRKLETIVEHKFISTALFHNYKIYNTRHYGHL
jgi:hypothetical protein